MLALHVGPYIPCLDLHVRMPFQGSPYTSNVKIYSNQFGLYMAHFYHSYNTTHLNPLTLSEGSILLATTTMTWASSKAFSWAQPWWYFWREPCSEFCLDFAFGLPFRERLLSLRLTLCLWVATIKDGWDCITLKSAKIRFLKSIEAERFQQFRTQFKAFIFEINLTHPTVVFDHEALELQVV